MRQSRYFIPTVKEVPNDAAVPSHILMVRAGMIRAIGAGIYSFLPLGYRVVKKVTEIIRQEMDAIGGQEFHLPALNPREIWEETGRVKAFGDTLFQVKNRDYVLAPTHEEIMAYHARRVIASYKDMPQIWYQIQTKFRNEPRPRSGVLRGRQFLMKDSYSLDSSWENLDTSYQLHRDAYHKIFKRCGLEFFVVGASSGAMGGTGSEEFMVQSNAGEDTVAYCKSCGYAANVEVALSVPHLIPRYEESKALTEISTPNIKSIDELCAFLSVKEEECAKSRVYIFGGAPILILMQGNEEVNEEKLAKLLPDVRPAHPDELKELTGASAGSIGPVGVTLRIIADNKLKDRNNLYSGANKDDYHLGGIDLQRDVTNIEYADLRSARNGEGCPSCSQTLGVFTAIELGHIFKLGTKYSDSMSVTFLDEKGDDYSIIMGSYGIGVERVIACSIEQHHDEAGIIWDKAIAPFELHLLGLQMKKEIPALATEKVYALLQEAGFDVLFDDRTEVQAGFKFKDADLLGMPVQVIAGEKKLDAGMLEIKVRKTGERFDVPINQVIPKLRQLLA